MLLRLRLSDEARIRRRLEGGGQHVSFLTSLTTTTDVTATAAPPSATRGPVMMFHLRKGAITSGPLATFPLFSLFPPPPSLTPQQVARSQETSILNRGGTRFLCGTWRCFLAGCKGRGQILPQRREGACLRNVPIPNLAIFPG